MPDERPLLLRDPRFREHREPGSHPERTARLDAIDRALEPLSGRIDELEPRSAELDEIMRAHDRSYVEAMDGLSGQEGRLDADTYVSPRSIEVARLAAGGSIDLATRVARGDARRGFALVRPPGHHAESTRAMGFCLFNNVAIAARALAARAGLERIAIVDWDVHHGNGTQHLFEAERDVLFVSLHQYPFYPGTGALHELGSGPGAGATVNLPLPAGCGDAEYLTAFDAIVAPVLREFRPEIILVSAGFDAHAADPLGGMQVTTRGFVGLAERVRAVADDLCDGRLVLLLEGGYDLEALGASVAAIVELLSTPEPPPISLASAKTAPQFNIAPLIAAHASHWSSLRSRPRC
jgi:acetoin utilization deacetylase AcuC-like enzyme